MSEFIKLSYKKDPTDQAYIWAQQSINMSNSIVTRGKNIKNTFDKLISLPTDKPISLRFVLENVNANGKGLKYIYDSNIHFKNLVNDVPTNEKTKVYKEETNNFFDKAEASYKGFVKILNQINKYVESIKNKFPLIIEAVDKNPDVILVPYGTFNNFILDTNLKEYVFTIKPKYIVTLYRHKTFAKYAGDKFMLDGMGHPYVLPFKKYKSKNKYSLYKHDVFRSLSIYNKDHVPDRIVNVVDDAKETNDFAPYIMIILFVILSFFLFG